MGSVTSVAVVNQALGSLPSGYEFRTADSLISPYAGVQYYRTWLDGYAELEWVHLTLPLHRKPLPRLFPVRVSVAITLYRLPRAT